MSTAIETETSDSFATSPTTAIAITTMTAGHPEDAQVQVDDQEEGEAEPPLLHPDPSRLASCVRAPCLKKKDASGTSSPVLSSSPPTPIYHFTGITTLCSALPKRQVHFDAAPPEAGLTHSGDRYDRRPIECTRGGSQLDLSLPPRGTCTLYTDEADDEACEDEDENEECKQKRLQGFAKWARLKNGASLIGASNSFKSFLSCNKKESEQAAVHSDSNACSTPVHGFRSFGKLAGQSGLASPEPAATLQAREDEDEQDSLSYDDLAEGNASASCDDESDGEGRHEAFRKAVYAALSKDPNATPMPSPSVRPRWECVTSYFDPGSEGGTAALEHQVGEVPLLDEEMAKDKLSSGSPLSREQEDCKVTTWTQNQAVIGEEASGSSDYPIKSTIALENVSAKGPPSTLSLDGTSLTHQSSSPLSSRCSSDACTSESGGGQWSGSEYDAFDAAFGKGLTPAVSRWPGSNGNLVSKSLSPDPNTTPKGGLEVSILVREPRSQSHDSEHHDAEHTSSSSSGGGPGWMSSCCTSPEITPTDGEYSLTSFASSSQLPSPKQKVAQMTSIQHLAPLLLERRHSLDAKAGNDGNPLHRSSKLLYQMTGHQVVSSEGNSPQVLSCDEDEATTKPCAIFRGPSKKSRKPRRAASGDGKREESDRPIKTAMLSRSKSALATRTLLRKESAFHNQLDDEGALGGF